jgi:hypothetical protein
VFVVHQPGHFRRKTGFELVVDEGIEVAVGRHHDAGQGFELVRECVSNHELGNRRLVPGEDVVPHDLDLLGKATCTQF